MLKIEDQRGRVLFFFHGHGTLDLSVLLRSYSFFKKKSLNKRASKLSTKTHGHAGPAG